MLLVPYYYVQIARYCVSKGTNLAGVQLDKFNVVFFYILGFEFLIVGFLMVASIRKYFPSFYKDYGRYLIAATFLLTVPMIFHALNTQLYLRYGRFYNYQRNH